MFADPDAELRDVVTRASLERVLTHYRESGWRADRVVATGDLIQDDSFEAYERFRELMLPLNLRVHCVPGNHDVRDLMKKVCCVPPFSYCAYEEVRNWLIVGIDSCLGDDADGDASGEVSGKEFDRLEGIVANSTARHVMICLHHPPVLTGSKGLDSVGLRNRSEVVERLRALARVRVVAFGHVHQEIDEDVDGLRILATPSTCRQFKPLSDSFESDDKAPAYRRITLHGNGSIDTEVVWVGE